MAKVLDTNILVLAVRNSPIWQKLSEKYEIEFQDAYISIVSEAEIWSLAAQFDWGQAKLDLLKNMLSNVTVVPIHTENLVDAYIQIDLYSQKKWFFESFYGSYNCRRLCPHKRLSEPRL